MLTTLEKELVGERIKDDIVISEISEHFMQRLCGTSMDPKIYEEQLRIIKRSGVEVENVIDAVKNGICLKTKTSNGQLSNTYINDNCQVTLNPITGKLIQCNLRKRK